VYNGVVGAVLAFPQPQREALLRVLLDVGHQYVVLVFALPVRPIVRITRQSVPASLVVVPNNRPRTVQPYKRTSVSLLNVRYFISFVITPVDSTYKNYIYTA